ncbi:MAG TPA: LLM class flavin-dependent oxidoreductase [Geobacterales bacterium]|nr:LLM class flavin-dependent oxidoreductase [Geobacterales bacterium]
MQFGICLPNYGDTLDIEGMKKIALLAEELGYDSIWLTDHILMPRNSGTPYENILETITSMAYLSCLTRKIKIGISSLVIALRNPVIVAKELATIDLLSNGRVMLAVATGWNEKEFNFLGSNFHKRGKIVNESIELMLSLWQGKNSFEGRNLRIKFQDAVFSPNVKREIEIWIAGNSEFAMKRAIKYGHAWHPNIYPLDFFKKLVDRYMSLTTKPKPIRGRIGFDISAKENTYIGSQGERRIQLSQDMNENRKIIEKLESMGVDYLVLATNPNGRILVEKQEEAIKVFASKFL